VTLRGVSIWHGVALGVLVVMVGCASAPTPPGFAELIGLEDSDSHEKLVRDAVARANGILGPDVPFRFRMAVDLEPPAPPGIVPVIVAMSVEPSQGICFVPIGTAYVVVDASEIPKLADTLSGNFSSRSELDNERLLTICLLHEAGHIFHGDSGVGIMGLAGDQFNDTAAAEKELELRADRFAARQISEAMDEQFPSSRFTAAAMLPVELQNVSFNLTGRRLIDNFGKSTLRPREVFFDDSLTHPNLELRMLLLNYFIFPTEERAVMVEEFQRSRERSNQPYRFEFDR